MNQKASSPVLYLVPTPIGNFQDMTFRAVEVLKSVDLIYAEDTRVTKVLLSHFNINTPLHSYHIFNEKVQIETVLDNLQNKKNIALVSDAGLPGISDPGYLVVREAIAAGFNVVSLPGANAALTALIASGLPTERFFFVGFLNSRSSQREKELRQLQDYPETLIFYEAPHRIAETLVSMHKVLGNRRVVIARELTKKYEEYIRGTLDEIVAGNMELRGEIVIIIEGAKKTATQETLNQLGIQEHFRYYLEQGYPEKEAMKAVAKDRELSKSEIYKQIKT
ncbi:MAG: 16S rRNA (cytidine(1402)-2'-O)-methyltransferase [Acholeplasmataceae bacterium]|jgi:16S rRNA (cytidine1402-2'-O)-methyltransferase|nr:16S rRNA (cytidine(1402)-2'-O)-methyltransferase [Acholeplasmataceae bacterium]